MDGGSVNGEPGGSSRVLCGRAALTPAYMSTQEFSTNWAELKPRVQPIISLARQERK